MMKSLSIVMVLLFSIQALAIKADFNSVKEYHRQEIDLLLKDYTLEESLTIRVELNRKKDVELKEQEIVSLPGLYQKTGEATDESLENVLNLYERKFVFIKKREIAEEEMNLVKSSLSERLFLPEDTVFTTLDNTPKLDTAVKNIKSDFFFGAYKTLIKNGQFLWILIFSIGFIVALWVLAKVWKNKSDEAGGEFTISGGGLPQADDQDHQSKKNDQAGASISLDSAEFETFNFLSLCQNINDAYDKAPGATSQILWQRLPDLQTQIQFYEIIRIQHQIAEDALNGTFEVLDKVFSFKERASKNHGRKKAKGFNKEDLSFISVELARLKFIDPDKNLEKCLTALYPKNADHIHVLFAQGMNDHHIVLYKIFKDEFMSFMSSKNDSSVLSKIDDLLTFDPEQDMPEETRLHSFAQFLEQSELSKDAHKAKRGVNAKVVHMIYGLPETELMQVEAMKNNEDLKTEVPCFSWINTEDGKSLKEFYASLSGPELKYLLDFDNKFTGALSSMDERMQFRVKERITKEEHMKINWREFRNKIKKHYAYEGARANENAKAS